MKVIVGMSGGVDSSMAAYLLKKQGFEVEGLSLILFETRGRKDPRACCSLRAVKEASETAASIGIPHRSVDAQDVFIEKVIMPFAEAYKNGLTPNPCILCNKYIKFPILLEEADKSKAAFIATGHYAKRVIDPSKRVVDPSKRDSSPVLKRGVDEKKDQSYVLYALRKKELQRLLLPLGDYRKAEIKAMAKDLGLPVFSRPESQEICFIEGRNYMPFIRELYPEQMPGPIIAENGKVIGTHKGIYRYTIGQRKGLGIASPHPLYVTKIDADANSIHVGRKEAVMLGEFEAGEINWHVEKKGDFRATVKVRSMMKDEPAAVYLRGKDAKVVFDKPQWAPAPGQSAVFYEGDVVIGGGVIKK